MLKNYMLMVGPR